MINWPEQTSVDDAVRLLKNLFVEADISTPELDARLIILDRLGLSHEELIADPDRPISVAEKSRLEETAMRRLAHEPMSHILGCREFYGRNFSITSDVLTPRPDSEVLIDKSVELLKGHSADLHILDLGVGSGCLLLTLLDIFKTAVGTGVDLSGAALDVARKNANDLGLGPRADFHQGRWFGPVEGEFDFIISNPPYIESDEIQELQKEVRDFEPRLALDGGADGLAAYDEIIKETPAYLKEGGRLVLEIGHTQREEVYKIFEKYADRWDMSRVKSVQDLAGRDRCIYAVI